METMNSIKNRFNKLFFHKITTSVVLPVIIINIIGVLLLFGISLIVDYQGVYKKLPLSESIEFQVAAFIAIAVMEIILISVVSYRFIYSSTNIISKIEDILKIGESNMVEFKSSLRFDYVENKINKELEYVIAKTISAFLNASGGTLLIGVDDSGKVLGLEADYETLKKKNSDGFIVYLTQIINYYLGKNTHRYLNITIESLQDKEICLIQILPAKKPTYVNHNERQEFFVRITSSVQPMDVRDAHDYIVNHWKQK
jgi:hypothetical protein